MPAKNPIRTSKIENQQSRISTTRHLHREIDRQRCDVTHVTRRTGRPYTLVCKKTTASYEKSREIYRRDQANLKRLGAIEKRVSKAAE